MAFTNLPPNRRRRLRSFHAAVARAGLSASNFACGGRQMSAEDNGHYSRYDPTKTG
jgi:hypothetical protein